MMQEFFYKHIRIEASRIQAVLQEIIEDCKAERSINEAARAQIISGSLVADLAALGIVIGQMPEESKGEGA